MSVAESLHKVWSRFWPKRDWFEVAILLACELQPGESVVVKRRPEGGAEIELHPIGDTEPVLYEREAT